MLNSQKIKSSMKSIIEMHSLTEIDYISIADHKSMEEVEKVSGEVLISMAVFVDGVRLIDNVIVNKI